MSRGFVTCFVLLSAPAGAFAQEASSTPERYVVRPGDTCVRIARERYGDSRATAFIHAANPNLGPPPHRLRPGTTLVLPPRATGTNVPDALLTAVHNTVEVQTPAPRPGRPNDPLYRGMRVNAEARSSAEVTFADETQLQLSERTLVVILGETSSRVARTASARDTVLERGALTAFLAGIDRQRAATTSQPSVRTAAGRVTFEPSSGGVRARLEVDEAARTTVSMYQGASQVEGGLRQRVRVPQGYGVRAVRGQRIPPPRLLPLAPVWDPMPAVRVLIDRERMLAALLLTDRERVTLVGGYRAGDAPSGAGATPPAPAAWRVEVARDARFNELVANQVGDGARTRLEVPDVEPGVYHVRVSAIDAEGFQGPPSEPMRVVVSRVVATPATGQGTARRVTITPAEGLFCALDGASLGPIAGPIEFDRLRAHTLRCALSASGEGATEFTLPAERLGPLQTGLQLGAVDARAGRATARLELRDGEGVPVVRDAIVVEPVGEGLTVEGTSPSPSSPGGYDVSLAWSPGVRSAVLRVRVDDEEARTEPVSLPERVMEIPATVSERWYHRVSLRVEGGAGAMLSAYQRNTDRNDPRYGGSAPGLSLSFGGEVIVGVDVLRAPGGYGAPMLTLQAVGSLWRFPVSEGSTLGGPFASYMNLGGGLRVEPFAWRVRPFLDAHATVAFTWPFVKPGFDVGLGVDVPLGRAVHLGAFARYFQVIDDGAEAFNEDARVITGGVSFTLRPPSPVE